MYTSNILVNKVLDYDVIQQVKLILYVQVCEIVLFELLEMLDLLTYSFV